jgi:hypothetical protein
MSDTTYELFQHYGTNAERLAFVPDPAAGIQPLYAWYETDTGSLYIYYTSWVLVSAGASANSKTLVCAVDGGGSVISTGIKSDIRVPFGATITGFTVLADTTGNIVFDIWDTTYAAYPPTVANSITGTTAKPTITGAVKTTSTILTGWVTTINAGDCIRFNVDTCTTITRAVLVVEVDL